MNAKKMSTDVVENDFLLAETLKPEKSINIGKSEYKALAGLSQNGIFIFDGQIIYEANPSFSRITGFYINGFNTVTLKDIIDYKSYISVRSKMADCIAGYTKSFDEHVNLVTLHQGLSQYRLHVTVSRKNKAFTFFIGLLDPAETGFSGYNKLLNSFSEDNAAITGNLSTKPQKAFNFADGHTAGIEKSFGNNIFSRREQEVLKLSCQGLPMKIIADQMCITHKTVEKHRASLMEKTGSRNIVELILFALKNDLVELK